LKEQTRMIEMKINYSNMDRRFLKVENAAELIDVSPWTIRKWIKEHKLRYYRFGGAIRIETSDLLEGFAEIIPSEFQFTKDRFESPK
jgi:excisionase family DNA binding protein